MIMTSTSPTPASNVLEFSDVALGYGDFTVLENITITAAQGQVVALMGGSGSGKTTLLRAATGQLKPKAGTLRLFGQNMASFSHDQLNKTRQRMGVLFPPQGAHQKNRG